MYYIAKNNAIAADRPPGHLQHQNQFLICGANHASHSGGFPIPFLAQDCGLTGRLIPIPIPIPISIPDIAGSLRMRHTTNTAHKSNDYCRPFGLELQAKVIDFEVGVAAASLAPPRRVVAVVSLLD